MNVKYTPFDVSKPFWVPEKCSQGAVGWDVRASEDTHVYSGEWAAVKTNLVLEFNPILTLQGSVSRTDITQVYCRIAPKSGLAVKLGIDTLAGVVDSDYRGEIVVVLMNHGKHNHFFKAGDKIAQLIFEASCPDVSFEQAETLSESERGQGGFGSTGK